MNIAIVDKFHRNFNAFSKQLKFKGHQVTYLDCMPNDQYELVHFDWCDDLAVAYTSSLRGMMKRPRVTIRLHAYEVHEDDWINSINYNAVDSLIFVSQHYQDIFNSKVVFDKQKQHVVNHGIDLVRYGISEHKGQDILYVGSVNFKKGPQLLAQVALAFQDRAVHVYGDVQCERSQLYLDNLKLNNLKFFPHNNKIEDVMHDPRYKYILSTSLGESFHLAVAEGMACGLMPLVHAWYGADQLWPFTWKSIDELRVIANMSSEPDKYRAWVESRYNAAYQAPKLETVILGDHMSKSASNKMPTIAVCMITRSGYAGVERALKSCCAYVDAAYIAVDSKDEDDTLEKLTTLSEKLNLKIIGKKFDAAEPWDFSYARNIAHRMNECDYALVLDDDEFVQHPEEIRDILNKHGNIDTIDVTCGMGVDEYGNVSDTWKFTRIMKRHVMWKNPRHNIPNPDQVSSSMIWKGNLIVVDDKSIKKTERRSARSKQRESNVDEFRRAVDKDPNDTRSLFYLATAYRESGLYWDAIHWYKQYLATGGWDEERWQACYDLALCQISLKRYTEARESLHTAIKEKFDRAEAFVLMGDIFYECENFKDAVLWYELGCALPYPEEARLFVQKGVYDWERYDKLSMAYNHIGDYQKSIYNAEKVLKVRPGDERIKNNIKLWMEDLASTGSVGNP